MGEGGRRSDFSSWDARAREAPDKAITGKFHALELNRRAFVGDGGMWASNHAHMYTFLMQELARRGIPFEPAIADLDKSGLNNWRRDLRIHMAPYAASGFEEPQWDSGGGA